MIIKFDRTPEEYFRLSRTAFGEGDSEGALRYGEKALRGKGTTEYKVSLAEIFLSMERFSDAADLALDALCYGRGMRSEIYDVLIRSMSESGRLYESVYYIARKAKLEGDDEAIDAMDEMMEDFVSEAKEPEPNLFLLGKEKKKESGVELAEASLLIGRGDYEEAIALLSRIGADSAQYAEAKETLLRAYEKTGNKEGAATTAEEIVRRDPTSAYALYILIAICGRKEYLPLLAGVKEERRDLYFAIAAADEVGEYGLSKELSARLVRREKYLPEAYFVAAAALLNGGDKKGSLDYLKRLFSTYSAYPAELILQGWERLKKCEIAFNGALPDEVQTILRRYVRKGAKDSEKFVRSMLTDETFRAAVTLLLEEGDREVGENLVYFLGVENNRQVDAFFTRLLIRSRIDPFLKRAILAELLFHKEKGKLWVAPTGVPIRVSCEKPPHYAAYPDHLKLAFVNIYSFVTCLGDGACGDLVADFAERLYPYVGLARVRSETLVAVMLHRLLKDGSLRPFGEGLPPETACAVLMEEIFGIRRRIPQSEIKRWSEIIRNS